jgi:hypothetical protein
MDAGRPIGLSITEINGGRTFNIGREVFVDGERIERARPPRGWKRTLDRETSMKWIAEFADEVANLANDPDANYRGWMIIEADGIPFKVHFWEKHIPGLGHVIRGEGPPLIPFD